MMIFLRSTVWLAAATLTGWVSVATAAAQTSPGDQPTRSLRLSVSASGGYDTDVTGTGGPDPADPTASPGAPHAGARVSLAYLVRSDRLALSARGAADSRHYRTDQPITAASYSGSAVLGVDVTSRLKLGVSADSAYSPQFMFSVLPVAGDLDIDIAPPPLDYGVAAQRTASYLAGANASLQVSRRSSLNVAVSGGSHKFLANDFEVSTRSYGGGYSYAATRYATLRVGYSEQISEYPAVGRAQGTRYAHRSLNAGMNYSRPLSASRRTTVSFGSGSSGVDDGRETFYTFTGNVSLRHQIGRSWETNVVYARGLGVVGGFAEPFFADSVNANLRGHLTNRLALLATVGGANGNVGLGSLANDYASFQGSTRLEWVVKRNRIGVFGNYFYYTYEFDNATFLAIPRRVNRHGVKVGIVIRFPLLQERTRRVTR